MDSLKFDKEYLEIVQTLPSTIEEYQYWLGLNERKIYFNDEVDMSIINKAIYWILRWNEEDDKLGLVGEQRPEITIYLSTNGGDVVSGLALADVIKSSKTKVVTVGIAVCASMGAILLMSGHYRKTYPNTVILLHDGNLALQASGRKAKNTMDFYDRLDEKIKQFVIDNTKISKELYEEKEHEEWYIFADPEGKELGIVDEIL